jgi:peptidoglycan/xylan/chitin deacetylase (PgdA/CDA1 family)
MSWLSQYNMARTQEKQFIAEGVKAIHDVTGKTARGYNCNWLRRSINTISILQELGFLYHIDDLSRDEPFILMVNSKPFVVVPYTVRCNDIVLIEGRNFSPDDFFETLKYEFDQLYSEGDTRRRQMSISTHDRIGGTPAVVRALDKFLEYAKKHAGVWFARKDEIAEWALTNQM